MSISANLQIAPQVPSEFTPAVPMTSSDFVVSRRMREYISDGARSFSYDGNNVIKFTLNSADAFLDGRNSWLQFKLFSTFAGGSTIGTNRGDYLARFLETGGAHSLFSRMRISLSNGTIISDYDYSQLYAMVRQHTMSAQHLQHQEGSSSYDDLHSWSNNPRDTLRNGVSFEPCFPTARVVASDYDAAGGNLTVNGVATNRDRILQNLGADVFTVALDNYVGDEILIVSGTSQAIGKIVNVQDDGKSCALEQTQANLSERNIATAAVDGVYKFKSTKTHRFRGAQGISSTEHVLCKIKLFSDFFNNIKYLPLPFLRNLTIELTLNRPAHSVVFCNPAAGTPAFSWSIEDPVIVANLVTPSESLMNAYVEQYNSEQGIMLHWIDYQSNRVNALTATSDSVRIPSNCHSALAILVAQKLGECQSVNASSWVNDTNGTNVKQNISTYQFQVGSEYFPFARPVDCGSGAAGTSSAISNGNAWNYVLQALDSHGAKYECSSILPSEYYAVNTIVRPGLTNATNDSLRFVLAARLDRDGNYTGIDTSNNDIQLNITRSAVALADSGLYYHCFIIHNRLIRISKASTIVFS